MTRRNFFAKLCAVATAPFAVKKAYPVIRTMGADAILWVGAVNPAFGWCDKNYPTTIRIEFFERSTKRILTLPCKSGVRYWEL